MFKATPDPRQQHNKNKPRAEAKGPNCQEELESFPIAILIHQGELHLGEVVTNPGLSRCSRTMIPISPHQWPGWLGLMGIVCHEHLESLIMETHHLAPQISARPLYSSGESFLHVPPRWKLSRWRLGRRLYPLTCPGSGTSFPWRSDRHYCFSPSMKAQLFRWAFYD